NAARSIFPASAASRLRTSWEAANRRGKALIIAKTVHAGPKPMELHSAFFHLECLKSELCAGDNLHLSAKNFQLERIMLLKEVDGKTPWTELSSRRPGLMETISTKNPSFARSPPILALILTISFA